MKTIIQGHFISLLLMMFLTIRGEAQVFQYHFEITSLTITGRNCKVTKVDNAYILDEACPTISWKIKFSETDDKGIKRFIDTIERKFPNRHIDIIPHNGPIRKLKSVSSAKDTTLTIDMTVSAYFKTLIEPAKSETLKKIAFQGAKYKNLSLVLGTTYNGQFVYMNFVYKVGKECETFYYTDSCSVFCKDVKNETGDLMYKCNVNGTLELFCPEGSIHPKCQKNTPSTTLSPTTTAHLQKKPPTSTLTFASTRSVFIHAVMASNRSEDEETEHEDMMREKEERVKKGGRIITYLLALMTGVVILSIVGFSCVVARATKKTHSEDQELLLDRCSKTYRSNLLSNLSPSNSNEDAAKEVKLNENKPTQDFESGIAYDLLL